MNARKFLVIVVLILSTLTPAGQAVSGPPQPPDPVSPLYIRLARTMFDPLQALPDLPARLSYTSAQATAASTYIVQFSGPVMPEWKQAITTSGGQLGDYIPDYAFLAHLDGTAKALVGALPFVRWVGPYQPAYKLSPDVDYNDTRSYRVILAPWAKAESTLTALSSLGAQPRSYSQGFAAVLSGEQLDQVARIPDVIWIEPYHMQHIYNDIGGGVIMGGQTAWASGYTGNGVTVAIADTGLDTGNPSNIHQDLAGRVAHISSWPVLYVNYGQGCQITNAGADDGPADKDSGHGTHVTGSVAGSGAASSGQFKGLGYQATITFQAVEQYTTYSSACGIPGNAAYMLSGIPDDVRTLLSEVYGWGARIQNDSWGGGTHGAYDQQASYFDDFVHSHPDMAVVVAAGNDGTDANNDGYADENSIDSPGTAKNVITVGASDNERTSGGLSSYTWAQAFPNDFGAAPTGSDRISDGRGELAAFSGRGPMNDGRIKPDVVAPGTDIISVRSSQIPSNSNGWGPYNSYYMYMGGTSMASPLTAGAAALVRDYYIHHEGVTNPSAALIKATLINTAVDIPGYGNVNQEAGKPIPNNHEGWGRVDVGAATTPGTRQFVEHSTGINTGATATYNYIVNTGRPFKISLVWSDYPSTPLASPTLVNNMNLRVTAPNGTTAYWGNNFSGGWSQSGGSADTVNNVENVYIQSPAAGQWTVEVLGQNVPQGPQAFALVVDGNIGSVQPAPTVTSITPNSGNNTGTVHITNLAGSNLQAGATVKLTRSGQADINATNVVVVSTSQITCDFDLTGAVTGQWNVVVTNPDSQSGTLPNGFTVSFSGKTWNGSTSSDWHTADNWTPSGVPTSTDEVMIPNVDSAPVISSGDAMVNGLTLNSGAVLDLTSRKLTVEGTLTNNGTLKQTQSVGGSSPTNFFRVTNLAGTLTKYYGVDITPSGAANVTSVPAKPLQPEANVTVSVSGNQFCTGRTMGVKRCFDIAPSAALTATVRFYLSEAERNGQILNDLLVYHYGGPDWTKESGPYARGGTGDAQYVQAQNISDFSPFALAETSISIYLPIVMNRWPPIPDTPTLNAISNPGGSGNYTVSWNAAYLADTYTLQEATNAAFSSPVVVYGPGSGLSWSATGKAAGTYYYRVKASNSYADSGWSNVQSVFVQPPSLFYAVADATALQGIPNTNDGTDSTMWTGYEHEPCSSFSGIARSLVKFDFSPIPAGVSIAQATLSIYLVGSCDTGNNSRPVTTYRITGDWSETSVTWNTQPGFAEAYGSSSVSSRTFQRSSVDVTNLVRAWVNHTYVNYGLMLRSPESSDSARLAFGTRQAVLAYAPYITITYAGAATSVNDMTTIERIPDLQCRPAIKGTPNVSSNPLKSGMFEAVEGSLCSRR